MSKHSLPQTPRELDATGKVIECGTIDVLSASLHVQPVLLMSLTRTFQRGSLTVQQYVVHLTACPSPSTPIPILYATLRAAEIVRNQTSTMLTAPYSFQAPLPVLQNEAQRLLHELETCVTHLLSTDPNVSQVITPARYRLPDTWVWQATCSDPHIVCEDRSWKLIEEVRRG